MSKWIAAMSLMIWMLSISWGLAAAQTPNPGLQESHDIVLSNLEVDLWPEYDQPDVLVIYHISLASNTPLPANLALRIPAASGSPNVAVKDTDGVLYNVAYTRTIQGDQATINFTAPSTEIQFEYYDPDLKKDGHKRTYTYQWPGDYDITSLSIQVQQPSETTYMQISPALGSPMIGSNALTYYKAIIGSVPRKNDFQVTLSYQKPTDDLSVKSLKVEPASPVNDQTSGRLTLHEVTPWLLGAVGVLLLAGLIWWYSQTGAMSKRGPVRKRHVNPVRRPAQEPDPAADVYCHQCGKRAGPGDMFCRACGARLRTGDS